MSDVKKQVQDEIETNITLTHFILRDAKKHPGATGQLSILLHALEIAAKFVSAKVRHAGAHIPVGVCRGE